MKLLLGIAILALAGCATMQNPMVTENCAEAVRNTTSDNGQDWSDAVHATLNSSICDGVPTYRKNAIFQAVDGFVHSHQIAGAAARGQERGEVRNAIADANLCVNNEICK
jgi:hypothetical protein